ncbi:3'(2'),5'-bisphosphate nucleotidase CysQ [Amorphus orientalis]|uniref:Myo-inositol-1(Or 4)-monophosphatase n=1 Tax=Amorphus orientalis TaxID=649198 RepID=A0AAE4ATY0_9HYPH|nr:3'(2'),5'-bisphosphate nucleotidase CysQ [Amorphus orientalis]MDQ0316725.1 myo-inositol-1(or 4)-monophosphatase [Amorphus orientalis]
MPDDNATLPGTDLGTDTGLLEAAAREAGRIALGYFDGSVKQWTKGDNSPVSEADLAVDRFLRTRLSGERPDYGWLSEESADTSERLARASVFVVDPIDGTRAFLRGADEWTISLAVVTEGRPTAAAVYCPRRDEMFLAAKGRGAWLGGTRLSTADRAGLGGARLAGPRKVTGHQAARSAGIEAAPVVPSLAYRIALVSAGRLDGAASTSGPSDWDLAGADLLVHEAGGRLSQLSGDPVLYNRDHPVHPPIAASGAPLHGALLSLLKTTLSDRSTADA